jgi:hypothetical protein
MIYVLDRDNNWWRAREFYRDEYGVRLDGPEIYLSTGNWSPYAPGVAIFEGAASDAWVPREFIKRIVT